MRKLIYNRPLLLILPLMFVAVSAMAQEVTKEFHKEYTAGANTTLDISNKYGDVVIHSWNKNQVVIDVKVTIEMPNREKAEKLLDYINVDFSESENLISAKTIIDDKFSFSGWGGGNRRFSINYNISMPVETALALSNRYGNTNIDELHGLTNIDIKYGNLTAGKLTRGNVKPLSQLSISYGNGSINETGWLNLYMRYTGNMDITKSQALLLDSKYSKLKLGETSSVVGENKYDNIKIDRINNLVLDNGYTEVNIGTLTKKLDYKGSYGNFTVDNIPAGFESLDVDTRYMGVKLGIEENASYNLEAKVSYGGLKYDETNFKNERRVIQNNTNEVAGVVGKEAKPGANVNVTASYGSVRLN